MRHTARDLSDDQWKALNRLIPNPKRRSDGRGHPWKSRRSVLNGILWVVRTGAAWADLPEAYPSFQTCHRRFQQSVRSGSDEGNPGGACFRLETKRCYRHAPYLFADDRTTGVVCRRLGC